MRSTAGLIVFCLLLVALAARATLALEATPAVTQLRIADSPPSAARASATSPLGGEIPRHVFLIVLENHSFADTFDIPANAYGSVKDLAKKGMLLTNYYGIGHNSLDNYIAMISGQAPNFDTQKDCEHFSDFGPELDPKYPADYFTSFSHRDEPAPFDEHGQAKGRGCVYPKNVKTLADQIEASNKFTWKAYMEDMEKGDGNGTGQRSHCRHPQIGDLDRTYLKEVLVLLQRTYLKEFVVLLQRLGVSFEDQYAVRHNPFMYFHSIIDDDRTCQDRVVPLKDLETDLSNNKVPNFAFITPNLCHDGHDPEALSPSLSKCRNGEKGGPAAVDAFLEEWVTKIENSKQYNEDGLIIITFDEAYTKKNNPSHADSTSMTATGWSPSELFGPNTQLGGEPGGDGPGGGRVGAVLLSPMIKGGTSDDRQYNHYSLLRTIEDIFGLSCHLGFAGEDGIKPFWEGLEDSQPRCVDGIATPAK